MNETSREQRPLLCEDFSEEEHFSEYPRRHRPCRGRIRNNVKGAAAIITRWPDHWSSALTHWWMALSVMALITFLIYNTLIAFVYLPPVHMKPADLRNTNVENLKAASHLPEIYMHVFANATQEIDVTKYLPYIEIISDQYLDFNFNLIIVYNDTSNEVNALSAEENNDIAFYALRDKEHFYTRKMNNRKNVNIKHVVLSHYMDESPLKKDWRRIPGHFIEFLVKAISIWEKGGIAINPFVLTPSSPHLIYMDKIQNILQKYSTPKESKAIEKKTKKYTNKQKDKYKKKVNNIRDIIDILENENSMNYSQDNLTEAEDRDNIVIHNGRKLLSTTVGETKNRTNSEFSYVEHPTKNSSAKYTESMYAENKADYKSEPKISDMINSLVISNQSYKNPQNNNHTSKFSLLPLFLEFLFHDKTDATPQTQVSEIGKDLSRNHKNEISIDKHNNETFRPMIIPADGIVPDNILKTGDLVRSETSHANNVELTIDLKGNVIATKTPCHAFIGTVFSNVVNHSAEETLRDFIIVELSLFCKGLLSSCWGIDVILL